MTRIELLMAHIIEGFTMRSAVVLLESSRQTETDACDFAATEPPRHSARFGKPKSRRAAAIIHTIATGAKSDRTIIIASFDELSQTAHMNLQFRFRMISMSRGVGHPNLGVFPISKHHAVLKTDTHTSPTFAL